MRKITKAFFICCMLMGLLGCGDSKEKYTPVDIKRMLEDNDYVIDELNVEDNLCVTMIDSTSQVRLTGFYVDEKLSFISYSNKSVNSGFYHLGILNDADTSTWSKLEKEYAKELEIDFDKWKDDLKISEEELTDFFNWYYKDI